MAQPIIPVRVPTASGAPSEQPRVPPTPRWVDALILCALAAVAYGIMRAAAEWRAPLSPNVHISLSARLLPYYAARCATASLFTRVRATIEKLGVMPIVPCTKGK